MTIAEQLPMQQGEARHDIACARCGSLVALDAILDAIAAGRPDDECPRCLTRSLVLASPDGLDIN